MKQVLRGMISCLCLLPLSVAAQVNITQVEYFFDNDPGFGNATQVTVTPAANIASLAINTNTAPLVNGMHTLFIRSKDANGVWSITNNVFVAKVQPVFPNPNSVTNIVKAEYFYDNDPGFGSGTDIPVTAATNISSLVFSANVTSLAPGMHTLFVRTKDASGLWSIVNNMPIAKVQGVFPNPNSVTNIVKAEYFYDNDPGFGSGTDIPVTPSTNISSFVFNANVAPLAPGMHTMFIRTKDASGLWSVVNNFPFAKYQPVISNPNTISNIVKAEYFFDIDPGFGLGSDVPVTAATDISGFVFNANVTSLVTGLHTIYIRTKDAQGKWSMANTWQFSRIQGVSPNPHTVTNINKAEYFYDTDPGFGNGTDIPVTPSSTITGFTFNANVAPLANGMHMLYLRTRDAQGQWSMVNNYPFAKVQPVFTNPNSISNIDKAEYYYDTDPGFGNGTNIPVAAATDISSFVFNANVAAITAGMHTLYVRTRDVQGKWSVLNNIVFAKVQALAVNPHTTSNLMNIEYFFDTDPGIGNAFPISFTPALDVNNLSFNVPVTSLVNGPHKLYIRSKDAQGKWSITNVHSFNGGTALLAIKLLSFDASVLPSKSVELKWVTEQESNVGKYIIERSSNASSWVFVGGKAPYSANSIERNTYTLVDTQPGKGIVYYRLTEVDLNGDKTQAPIRFVKIEDGNITTASVFPNPNDGQKINLKSFLLETGKAVVTILSADGRICYQQEIGAGSSTLVIDGIKLASGNYFININSDNKSESLKLQVAEVQ
jgi:hypothetical protein